ncbi:GNAT family N-acetyltransferase [Methylovirgula ligni]|uniref:GNAT family acetyltransferase n=1 Tax=Methylovirgula ligni TaxID=569860 RepID=A0A3D9Z1S7_9HYPH|nr:GNAT family N-acetyltransferase [Methylovirgula ligni]QAY96899.1 GNAT family N-acetyltransferase [Methylovirgula ligni]REF88048.1 GNAT family acetyltransferase [Methylovirgula ligni]
MSTAAKPALRPFLPQDAAAVAQIFRDAIEDLTRDDYDEAQRTAWSARADDEASFAKRLAAQTTLLALREGEPVGFVSLKGNDLLDMLFVRPEVAGEGVGTFLANAAETLARGRGAKILNVDASDTALPFFEKLGFTPQARQSIALDGEWLANTKMAKALDAGGQSR